jgi:multiple sugar transport system permease protein
MNAKRLRDAVDGYSMLLPTIVGVFVFFAFPLGYSLYLSFTNAKLLARVDDPTRFIGLENYANALQNSVFQDALKITFFFSIMVLIFSIIPALLLAVLINEKIRGQSFFRSVYFVPVVASVVGISLVWRFLFNKDFGWINLAIEWFGKTTGLNKAIGLLPISWLGNANYALTAVIIVFVWKTIGYNMVIFMSGLQGINKQLYEAASIDGANRWETLVNVTVPLLSPTTFFVLVTTLISCLQVFDVPYALGWTRGNQAGPADSMLTNVLHLYREAFINNSTGYASALAWILTLIILIITVIQFRVSKRWVNYE